MCITGLIALVLVTGAGTAPAQRSEGARAEAVDLTGEWRANDGGTYWIRQIGTRVWWTGFSGSANTTTMGLSFSNVFYGRISGSTIIGSWADVPRGATRSNGTLTLLIRGTANPILVRTDATGGFGASIWRR
jgi:hypothetical protein